METANWFDLDEHHGVLELDEHLTGGVGLELHLAHTPRSGVACLVGARRRRVARDGKNGASLTKSRWPRAGFPARSSSLEA